MLRQSHKEKGKVKREVTERGRSIGMSTVQKTSSRGMYEVILYDSQAQRYILEHMDRIEEINRMPKAEVTAIGFPDEVQIDPETGEITGPQINQEAK